MSLVLKFFKCPHCTKYFRRLANKSAHAKSCQELIKRSSIAKNCQGNSEGPRSNAPSSSSTTNQTGLDSVDQLQIKKIKSAFNGVGKIFRLKLSSVKQRPGNVFEILESAIGRLVRKIIPLELDDKRALKVCISLFAKFHQAVETDVVTEPPPCFNLDQTPIYESSDLDAFVKEQYNKLISSIDKYELRGSGWVLHSLESLDMALVEYRPLKIGTFVPTPTALKCKRVIVNLRNNDNKCFLYSILVGLLCKNPDAKMRIGYLKKHENMVNTNGLKYPVQVKDIGKFERNNQNISISVYGFDETERIVYPVRVVSELAEHHINLLFLEGKTPGRHHYCTIINFDQLLGKRGRYAKIHCRFCMHGFDTRYKSKDKLEAHEAECGGSSSDHQKLIFPTESHIEFTSVGKQLPHVFTVYADFESLLEEVNFTKSKKKHLQKHHAMGYCYLIESSLETETFTPRIYTGEDAAEHFLDSLIDDLETVIKPRINNISTMIYNDDAEQRFNKAEKCWICENPLHRGEEIIVRHHNHATGEYCGAAHQKCNLLLKQPKKYFRLPVVFHGASNYDWHLILQAVKRRHGVLTCIAKTMERYITLGIGDLIFRDSAMHLAHQSLDSMAKDLQPKDFIITKRLFPKHWELLTRKLPYPYDYFSKWSRLEETKLPARQYFFNKLTNTPCKKADYQFAKKNWEQFDCKTMKDFYEVYLKTDVLLLADVMTHFKKEFHQCYGLELMKYATLPGMSWDAMLKISGVKLEIIKDPDMLLMLQKNIRGGTAMIVKRYARINQPSREDYDNTQPLCLIDDVDANSLYAHAMQMPLPVDKFRWMGKDEIEQIIENLQEIDPEGPQGYIFEVDLEYPESLHDDRAHQNYPLAPENIEIDMSMWSDYQKATFPARKGKTTKLTPNMFNKKNYVTHLRNLQLYKKLDLVIQSVSRGIAFNQAKYLEPFIKKNADMRREAIKRGDKAKSNHIKNCSNSVFGKFIENINKRIDVEFVQDEKTFLQRAARTNFKKFKIFKEDLAALDFTKKTVVQDKHPITGFTILELSKHHMYKFYYEVYMKTFTADLLFTDTDSLCFAVYGETKETYQDKLKTIKQHFDFSTLQKTNKLYSVENQGVTGKMKPEIQQDILEFVGLRPKLYALKHMIECTKNGNVWLEETTKAAAKGVKKSVREGLLDFEKYKQCLFAQIPETIKQRTIRSDHHVLYTLEETKIGLSACDDKRLLVSAIDTYPHGHKRFKNLNADL